MPSTANTRAADVKPEPDEAVAGNRPVRTIRVGNVTASIWRNHSTKGGGGDFYNTTFEVAYQKDGKWKSSHTYSPMELLCLAKASDRAHDIVLELLEQRARSR